MMKPELERIGNYQIEEVLGKGAMGIVYKAINPRIRVVRALKVMQRGFEGDEELITRFYTEAQAAAALKNEYVIDVIDMGEHDGQPYIVMEYIEGVDLGTLIQGRKTRREGRDAYRKIFTPFARKLEIISKVAQGLDYAHRHHVIHRDIKPANILVKADGGVKILDFGLARVESAARTRSGLVMGTPYYMSPEHMGKGMEKGGEMDGRSDLFSLGVVLFEFLSLRRPFEGSLYEVIDKIPKEPHPPLRQVFPGCTESLAVVVDRALTKDRDSRFPTCADLADALAEIVKSLPDHCLELQRLVTSLEKRASDLRRDLCNPLLDGYFDVSLLDPRLQGPPTQAEGRVYESDLEEFEAQPDDYGTLLFRHADVSARLTELESLANGGRRVLDRIRICQNLLERDEPETCAQNLAELLALHPSSAEARRLEDECNRRLEQKRLQRETELRISTALAVARSNFDRHDYERCLHAIGTVLELDSANREAADLKERATAILERRAKAARYLHEAMELKKEGDFAGCLRCAEAGLEIEADNPELKELWQEADETVKKQQRVSALLREARVVFSGGDYEHAAGKIQELLVLAPGLPAAVELKNKIVAALELRRQLSDLQREAEGARDRLNWKACLETANRGLELAPEHPVFLKLHQQASEILIKEERLLGLIAKARDLLSKDDFSGALDVAREALRLVPGRTEAKDLADKAAEGLARQRKIEQLLQKALDAAERRDWAACLEAAIKGIGLDSANAKFGELRSRAEEALTRERRIDGLSEQARSLVKKQAYTEALEAAGELLRIDPENTAATEIRQVASAGLERTRRSQEALDEAVALETHARFGEAVSLLDAALRRDPTNSRLRDLSRRIGAERSEREKRIENCLRTGRQHLDQRSYQQSIEAFQEVLRLAPKHEEARDLLRRAEEEIRKEAHFQALLAKARQAASVEDFESCLASATLAFELRPENEESAELKAHSQTRLKQIQEHDTRVRELLEYSRQEFERGEFESALQNLTFLLQLEPDNQAAKALKRQSELASRRRPPVDRQAEAGPAQAATLFQAEVSEGVNTVIPHAQSTVRIPEIRREAGDAIPSPPLAMEQDQATAPDFVRGMLAPYRFVRLPFALRRIQPGTLVVLIVAIAVTIGVLWVPITGLLHLGVAQGTLVVAVSPWAEIESLVRVSDGTVVLSDRRPTPVVLQLEPGAYRIRLRNPYISDPLEVDFTIREGESRVIGQAVPGFEMEKEIDKILEP